MGAVSSRRGMAQDGAPLIDILESSGDGVGGYGRVNKPLGQSVTPNRATYNAIKSYQR